MNNAKTQELQSSMRLDLILVGLRLQRVTKQTLRQQRGVRSQQRSIPILCCQLKTKERRGAFGGKAPYLCTGKITMRQLIQYLCPSSSASAPLIEWFFTYGAREWGLHNPGVSNSAHLNIACLGLYRVLKHCLWSRSAGLVGRLHLRCCLST